MHTSVLKIYQSDYPQSSWEILTFLNSAMRYKEESEVVQSFLTLCNPMDCSLPDFSVHGIFQARILEWVTISFSRGSSQPRDRTWVSCIAGGFFRREASAMLKVKVKSLNRVQLFVTPWTVAYQTPLSMGFSRQYYWSGWPFPSPADLPDPRIEPRSPAL